MKRAKIFSMIFLTILLVKPIKNGLVYNQVEECLEFEPQICQQIQDLNLGDDFESTQSFSIWGWIKPNQNIPAISNIVSIYQQQYESSSYQNQYQNSEICEERNKELLIQQEKGQILDLVSVNYELNQDVQTFNIGFTYYENGKYKYSVIENLHRNDDAWTYFAFSIDYKSGNIVMYVQTMDGSQGNYKNAKIRASQLKLTKNADLVIGGTNEYLYKTATQYIGKIADVQMSTYFIQELDYQWAGYIEGNEKNMPMIDINFNVNKGDKLLRYQYYNEQSQIPLAKNSKPLSEIDNNKVGVRYYENSQQLLSDLKIGFMRQDEGIAGVLFYFDMMFSGDLDDNHVLLTRGQVNEDGFIQISLAKNDNDRVLRMLFLGDSSTELQEFYSPVDLNRNERHQFMIGLAKGPVDVILPLYVDLKNNKKIGPYYFNYPFSLNEQELVLLNPGQEKDPKNNSEFNMYRFIVYDSVSPAINFLNRQQPIVQQKINNIQELRNCQLSSSYYDNSQCSLCQNSILNYENKCVDYCVFGSKNGLNDVCVPCQRQQQIIVDKKLQGVCSEIDQTKWNLFVTGPDQYILEPSRKLLNFNEVSINDFQLFTEQDDKLVPFTNYEIVKKDKLQQFEINLKDENNISNIMNIFVFNRNSNAIYDINRNYLENDVRLFDNNNFVPNSRNTIGVYKGQYRDPKTYADYYCIDLDNRGLKMRILAYILLLAYAFTAFLLLLWTICCWNRFWDLGGLWKFLLHHWMKLNLVAFFILLAIYMPCCVREFLHQLYRFVVSWDHELRHWINNVNDDSRDYNRAFEQRRLPFQFRVEHIRPFILHNLLITFIAQLAIFAVYIVLKLWDYCNVWKKSCLFRWLVFWEFTALIVGYLLFHMRDFVFSGLNWRKAIFSHSYFVCCFLIAIFYVLVFWLFWIYSAIILLTKRLPFWSDITNVNKFYYFFVGYRNDRLARTYDHWVTLAHFIVAMMIGIVIYSPRAQMIVIVSALGVLFLITILLRPWKNLILLICDLLAQIAILLTVIFFLVYSIQDNDRRCIECDDRESVHCWIIVLFLFIALMLGLLGLLAAMFMDCCTKGKKVETTQQDIYHYNQENEIIQTNNNVYNNERSVYENVNNQNIVMGNNMMGSERVVNQQVYENSNLNQGSYQDGSINKGLNTYNTSTNQVQYNTSVNKVQAVQPDLEGDGTIQNEMIHAMNDKSHVEKILVTDNINNQNQYLHDERNQFYNRMNKDSNVDLYQVKNLGDNEHVFNDEIKVTKYTKTTHN